MPSCPSPTPAGRLLLVALAREALSQRAAAAALPLAAAAPVAPTIAATAGAVDDYLSLIAQVAAAVGRTVPAGAALVVISRGDDAILPAGYAVDHFPRAAGGGYAGFYPPDGEAAIAHLEACRAAGAEYLVVPATSFWWLDHYAGLAQQLLARARVLHHDESCLIFRLPDTDLGGAA